jgi:hypothetical protein
MEGRLTILPPPPTTVTMMWAAAKGLAFRAVLAVARRGRSIVRRAEIALAPRVSSVPPPDDRRLSWFVRKLIEERARAGDDRPTAVEVRRS